MREKVSIVFRYKLEKLNKVVIFELLCKFYMKSGTGHTSMDKDNFWKTFKYSWSLEFYLKTD